LLKNTNGALPLKTPKTISVFGNDAADLTRGQYSLAMMGLNLMDGDYDVGTLAVGGGSGTGRFSYVVSPLEAIKTRG
jgi:beta-glucosidase